MIKLFGNKASIIAAVIVMIMPVIALMVPVMAHAQPNLGTEYVDEMGLVTSDQDPREMAVSILNYLMTFLGIIAVAMILFGGFKWLTAGGNEDRVSSAKKTIIAGIIGLVIIIAAYAIVTFVLGITSNAINEGL